MRASSLQELVFEELTAFKRVVGKSDMFARKMLGGIDTRYISASLLTPYQNKHRIRNKTLPAMMKQASGLSLAI